MRIVFAGSPEIAVPSLMALAARHEIVGVLTNPDSTQGRGRGLSSTSVARAAAGLHGAGLASAPVPILAFETLRTEARETVAALKPDLLATFAYGRIFGPRFLSLFPSGAINAHPSLLPRFRGATPIPAAILAGERETGVCVQYIALEPDSGDILAVERIPLTGRETTASLSAWAAEAGARLMAAAADAIAAGTARALPQEGTPSHCARIGKADGLIDWSLDRRAIDARVRAFDPWPGAYTYLHGKKLDILECLQPNPGEAPESASGALPGTVLRVDKSRGLMVQTKDGPLAVTRLRFSTRKALSYKEFANGVRDLAGSVLAGGPEDDPSP